MSQQSPSTNRAHRPATGRVIGGVCAGIAEHLGVPVVWVRLGFAVLVFLNGAGLVAYAVLWRFMPLAQADESAPTDRSGYGPEIVQALAIGAIVLGVFSLGSRQGWFSFGDLALPLALLVVGVGVVWRLVDDAAVNSWIRQTSGVGFWLRLAAGLVLAALGFSLVVTSDRSLSTLANVLAAVVLAFVGIGLLVGPWALSTWRDLQEERRQRARSEAQADMAAHLHDSVLQTLALLQKNAKDPALVATMARKQERELREWLFGSKAETADSSVGALRAAAAEVEEAYQVPVEVVTVGDAPVDEATTAFVAAAREAIVNAAKHSASERIDVYGEVTDSRFEIFVRDRGRGFQVQQVPDDRRGIRDSLIARTKRFGGSVVIESAPGEGTQVQLSLPLATKESP